MAFVGSLPGGYNELQAFSCLSASFVCSPSKMRYNVHVSSCRLGSDPYMYGKFLCQITGLVLPSNLMQASRFNH